MVLGLSGEADGGGAVAHGAGGEEIHPVEADSRLGCRQALGWVWAMPGVRARGDHRWAGAMRDGCLSLHRSERSWRIKKQWQCKRPKQLVIFHQRYPSSPVFPRGICRFPPIFLRFPRFSPISLVKSPPLYPAPKRCLGGDRAGVGSVGGVGQGPPLASPNYTSVGLPGRA